MTIELRENVDWKARARLLDERCARCQEIHLHLRELAPGDTWPDERLNCGEDYEDQWGKTPEQIAALAFATADESQALGSVAKKGPRRDP